MSGVRRSDAEIALGVFAFWFAASVLLDWGRLFGNLYQSPLFVRELGSNWSLHATCGVALWLLLRPTSLLRLAALAATVLLHTALALPDVFNHSVFVAVVCVGLLGATGRAAVWRGGDAHRRVYEMGAPLLRVCLLVLYVWVTVHKLNWDFFDPSISCATVQLYQIQDRWSWLPVPRWTLPVAMLGTLAIEAALPLGLALARWRRHAVLLGCLFHLPLALHYPGFSVMLFAAYSLFVPREIWARWWGAFSPRLEGALRLPASPVGQGVAWLALFGLSIFYFGERGFGPNRRSDLAFVLLALATAVYASGLRPARGWERGETLARGVPPWLWLLPASLAVNGALPHLGIKNTQSFAMFSNLRTEGGVSNHVFLPASLQVSDNLRDMVDIERSNDPYLQRLSRKLRGDATQGVLMPRSYKAARIADLSRRSFSLPYEGLRHRVATLAALGAGNVQVGYRRAGERFEVDDAEHSPELAGVSTLSLKLLKMRPVPLAGPALCMW